ncbi:MAG: glycoside hydrolase family 2 protein [Dehalococcoidales bacterium]|nr:glycoside hydrolase family 2 protein [Dehalococcoidales bacterium]
MKTVNLNGTWRLKQAGKSSVIDATVPGNVHTDLLKAERIPDPYYRDNEDRLQWIGEVDWLYSREFDLTDDFLDCGKVLLRCEGLDTLAVITINSKEIARTDNMFRTYEFDVTNALRKGRNHIEIRFQSTLPYIGKKQADHPIPLRSGPHTISGGNWVRKEQCNFGWDWGPCLLTCGIWRSISLIAVNSVRLSEVSVRQKHRNTGQVELDVSVSLDGEKPVSDATGYITVSRENVIVASEKAAFRKGTARVKLTIEQPELWWPNGMGDQPLYDVKVELREKNGTYLDSQVKRIGFRTLKLQRKKDRWGESFRFTVNGIPFFAKGANWIPADTFAARLTEEDYRQLVGDAAAANMNMLRVWGGGIYEPDLFYDLCDELGICVWQDFMFACATYPAFDDNFMENVRAEVTDNVSRLRHHPCIALWCGNNEMEQGWVGDEWNDRQMSWQDYSKLFDDMIPGVISGIDPDGNYWPCSPHNPYGDRRDFNDIRWGDSHLWNVWHGKQPFEWYRTAMHRFCSEFGFQSFPEPQTVYGYTEPQDRNITSYVMEHHQRSGIGNTTIMTYMLDWFRLPADFEMTLWASQILQGLAMKYAIEHWRRNMPRTMGTLYWQHNDCWPVASWSSIDYHHRWKALHFMAKRFYSPLLVSGVEDSEKGTVEIHVTSDLTNTCQGEISWEITTAEGEVLVQNLKVVEIQPGKNAKVHILKCSDQVKRYGTRDLLVWLSLSVDGKVVSDNFVSFVKPKHIELPKPMTSREVSGSGSRFTVTLKPEKPALWTWLELEGIKARYSDNFFHLKPGNPVTVEITTDEPVPLSEMMKALTMRSLYDTYR